METFENLSLEEQQEIAAMIAAKDFANIKKLKLNNIESLPVGDHGGREISLRVDEDSSWNHYFFKHRYTIAKVFWILFGLLFVTAIILCAIFMIWQPHFFIALFGLAMNDTRNPECRARYDAAGVLHNRGICPTYFLGLELKVDRYVMVCAAIGLLGVVLANLDIFSRKRTFSEKLHADESDLNKSLLGDEEAEVLVSDSTTSMIKTAYRDFTGLHQDINWLAAHGASPKSVLLMSAIFVPFLTLAAPYTGDHSQSVFFLTFIIAITYQTIGFMGVRASALTANRVAFIGPALAQLLVLIGIVIIYYFGGYEISEESLSHDRTRVVWAYWGFLAFAFFFWILTWLPFMVRALRAARTGGYARYATRGQIYVIHNPTALDPREQLKEYKGPFDAESLSAANAKAFVTDLPHSDFMISILFAHGATFVVAVLLYTWLFSIRFSLEHYLFV